MIEINWSPDRRMLRQFGLIGLVVFGGLAAWSAYRGGVTWAPIALGSAATLFGALALVAPGALKPVFVGMSVVTAPIGFVVSHVVLGLVYFGLFTPVRAVQTIAGRDALNRRFDRQAPSYWTRRETNRPPASYFRQS